MPIAASLLRVGSIRPLDDAAVLDALRDATELSRELISLNYGAFLVWGDPSLYDSTLRIIERIISRGTVVFEYKVFQGSVVSKP